VKAKTPYKLPEKQHQRKSYREIVEKRCNHLFGVGRLIETISVISPNIKKGKGGKFDVDKRCAIRTGF
jgi:hypothetical protein